jgi:hypothetical protein
MTDSKGSSGATCAEPVRLVQASGGKPKRQRWKDGLVMELKTEVVVVVFVRAVPAFDLGISQAIYHSKDLSEKNLT